MRLRNLVVLFTLLGLATAACAQTSALSLSPLADTADTSSRSGGADTGQSGSTAAESGSGESPDESGSDAGAESGSEPESESGSASKPVEGWSVASNPESASEVAGDLGGDFQDIDAAVYTPEGVAPGVSDVVVVSMTLTGEQATQFALMQQMGGDILGDRVNINGKRVYKISDDPEYGGCMLMWQKFGATWSIAQGAGSCSEVIPLVEQII